MGKPPVKQAKIRNLVSSSQSPKNQSKCCRRFTRCGFLFAVLSTIIGILIFYFDNVAEMHQRLRAHVDRQYKFHLYGKMDYCSQMFQPDTLTEPLKLLVINQNEAISQISSAIVNLNGGVSLALVGGSGVGKTLTCNVLQANFQWPSNVLYFVWSSNRSKSSHSYKIVNSVEKNSKNCGAHLVIIDSIDITYKETIQELNDEIQKEFFKSDISILVVYVFNLASYSDQDLSTLDEKRRRLKNLSGITTINFRSFNRYDVERCIGIESEKLNLSLNNQEIEEIFEYIDSSRSGSRHEKASFLIVFASISITQGYLVLIIILVTCLIFLPNRFDFMCNSVKVFLNTFLSQFYLTKRRHVYSYVRTTKMEAQNATDDHQEKKSIVQLWKTFTQQMKDTVYKYLDFNDILQASLVCKAFYYELGQSQTAMNKIKFRVQADWSEDIRAMLESTPRNYTFINIYSDGGPRTTIQFFKNFPYWTHIDLDTIQFANLAEWINYVKSFPRTLKYLKLTNITVPYQTSTTAGIPLKALKELHFYEDPEEIRMFVRRTGYDYAPYHALLALGDMPELRKLLLCGKKDYILAECPLLDKTISKYFKGQKFTNLEMLAVGHERLQADDFCVVNTGIKTLYLFGYQDSASILGIWNSMANKGLETISIHFLNRIECYDSDNIIEGVFEFKQPIQSHDNLKQLILCYDKVKMPLKWYRNFFRAQNNLVTLKVKWLRKDVLKSAVKMLPNLREIHYEKFYDLVESNDDEDEDLYANDESESGDEYEDIKNLERYYDLIKKSSKSLNKNVQISKRTIRNKFVIKN